MKRDSKGRLVFEPKRPDFRAIYDACRVRDGEAADRRYKHAIARALLRVAVAHGRVTKPVACEHCRGEPELLHGHHTDYNKPIDVVWLCQPCHAAEHRRLKARRKRSA